MEKMITSDYDQNSSKLDLNALKDDEDERLDGKACQKWPGEH